MSMPSSWFFRSCFDVHPAYVLQRDFGGSRCSVCGMLYTKGLEEDEKLHKAYHQGAVQGLKFQVSAASRLPQLLVLPPFNPGAPDAGQLLMLSRSSS
jgi:hypothetical protein